MTDPSRRRLLGTTGAVGLGSVLGTAVPASAAGHPSQDPTQVPAQVPAQETDFDTGPVRAALGRLLPEHADQFHLTRLSASGERFRVTGSTGRITVAGTGRLALLAGVHWYLKYTCGAHISWSGSQLDLPERLPEPDRPLERAATVPHRFVFNDTHDGYTAPYADWPRWERMIDVLALHGCNEVLVTAGQEAVYHRLLQDFGYSDTEARGWLPAPTHQPWWLLQNMSAYGGPLGHELIGKRADLGRRIADRLREFDMRPVLPGYFGTVPDGFAERNPGARTVPQGDWSGLKRPDWLDPRTDSFAEVAAAFYRHQGELFGEVDVFKMDLLHEGGSAGDVPVPEAARAVESALRRARPGATWAILGWQANPRRELIDALDKRHLLIVDGLSDLETVTDREKDWGGAPYAFGTIPNFGGRTTIGAKTHMWTERFTVWRDKPGSKLVGTAYMPEAAERDPAALELFTELAWRDEAVDRAQWFQEYADLRYGGRDGQAREAMAALRDTAYRITSKDGRPHDSIFAARPSLTANSGTYYATHTPAFPPGGFDRAFAALLGVREPLRGSDAYRHDLTDVARQALANRSWQLLPQLRAAYGRKDLETFRALARLWLKLMRLSEDVTGSHRAFLLGPWLDDALRTASSPTEAEQLERTARVLITTWADRATADGGRLARYANRDWHGLIGDFHLPQWTAYLDELEDALAAGREPRPFDWYAVEEPWTRERKSYPLRPPNDAYRTARQAHDVLARAPYQGTVALTAEPPAFPPGGHARVQAVFTNVNGLRDTGQVDFALTGLDAQPEGSTSLPSVPAAGTGKVTWRAEAPAEPLTQPLRPLPYELSVRYGPRGEDRVSTVVKDSLYVAGPLDPAWRTYTNSAAVFGQLEGRYAINGGGQDLWKGTSEFGAAYREGALKDGVTVTVRVDAQDATGPWARAGIVARNSLATPGSPGFVNLSVTPANGVALSYDTNGDGTLDTYQRITGIKAPVLLRLRREAGTFWGACSTDDGTTWRTVAEVPVGGATATQDVGLFMTATHGGSGARGTAEFSGFTLE
ncbi:alpha-N-acetylglucosaminidase [Streptomyces boluensis]|uniref:Alpha-N-acetylglucosaminidase n=1 Tax=Streptomyces boluensis TaxID=1775135 RepID=A0A964XMX6_9ACTN|nr:alpha-N-acetylglucosaminidase [Streptomyces boluensis]NBE53197.1 alpha-N-acetylglucosaminidase [Streptomyces boluensis]